MNIKIKTVIISGMLAVAGTGCKKSFYDINKNPNNITASSVTSDLILPSALHFAGAGDASGNSSGYDWLNKWMGYWSNSGSFAPTQEEITYNITSTFLNARWTLIYNNLNDFTIARDKAIEEGKDFYAGIAKVMRARYFQDLVDIYGNVPYSQAFNIKEFPTPKYDKGQDVYNGLQVELDEAIAIFETKPVPTGGSTVDIVYNGNRTLWTRFANTLKLRLLIRQSEVPGFNPAAEIAKIVAKGGVLQSGESADANPGYTNAVGKQNPFYATNGFDVNGASTNEGDRANKFFVDLLKTNSDPRLQRYFRPATTPPNPADPYVGTVFGSVGSDATNSARTSGFGPGLIGSATQSQWILTSVESLFFYAEAVARGWIAGDAKTAFENAVRESFIWLGVPNAVTAANTYMASVASANWANAGATALDKAKFVVAQKYFAMAGFAPLEAWSDYRRLGVPTNLPLSVDPGRVGSGLPVRLLYPLAEYAVNKENVQAEGNINQFTSKVFWDQ
ncbi:MAG: SusD/RagB family nutrient-binding outer membrane lipoprotein [Chitinophagaceae bacterium]